MTELQNRLLVFIRDEIEQRSVCPTYAEMAQAVGLKSKSGPYKLVDILVREGHLVRGQPGSHQTLRLASANLSHLPTSALVAELERRGVRLG